MPSSSTGNSVVNDIKSGLKGIHSAGEAICGTFNESVDHAFNDKSGEVKNQAIADKGGQGVRDTDEHFGKHHGVASSTGLKTGGLTEDTVRIADTAGAGTHSGVPGNLGGHTPGGVAQSARTEAQEASGTTERY